MNIGESIGLAWTSYGGKIMYIETSKSKGSGKINITGSLGDVYLKQYIYNLKICYQNLLWNTNPYVIPNN